MLVENIYESLKTLEPDLSVSRFCTEYLDTCRSYLHKRISCCYRYWYCF